VPQGYGLPVAVFCPPAALAAPDVEVLFFAHGLLRGCPRPAHVPSGFVTDMPFGLGSVVAASRRPMVLVVPLLDWARPGGEDAFGRGHERWHALAAPARFDALIGEVMAEVGRARGTSAPGVTSLVVAGHSRAYDFLEPLAESRREHRGVLGKLSEVWAFDTTYAGRVSAWVDWVSVDPSLRVHIFYRPDSRTAAVGESFRRRARPGLVVTPVPERHCDVPATRLRELLPAAAAPAAKAETEAIEAEAIEAEAIDAEAGEAEAGEAGDAGTALSAEELTTRIVRCIGIWETNRGGDQPAPRESALETVAGVHASMATVEQATMPYAITVLRRHKALRDRARPPLTLKELNAADARVVAVQKLLAEVAAGSAAGTAPDAFIAGHRPAIAATGLGDDDVRTMFRAETLKETLATARTQKRSLAASIAAIPGADRLGLGASSLVAYANRPSIWGENRAGWQRRAVQAMPDDLAARIEAVATSDNGTALTTPTVRGRVDTELAKSPAPATEEVVRAVAHLNNPNEPGYAANVWKTYRRLYP